MIGLVDASNLLEIPNLQAGIIGVVSALIMGAVGHFLYHHDQRWIEEDLNRLFKSMSCVVMYVALIFLFFGMVDHGILFDGYDVMLSEATGLRYVLKLVGAMAAVSVADWATQLLRDEKRAEKDRKDGKA